MLWVSSNFGAVSIHFDSQDFEILMSGGDILCSSDYCSMRGITQDSVGTIYCSFYNSICAFDCKTNKRQDLGFQIKDNPYALLWHDGKLFSDLLLFQPVDFGYIGPTELELLDSLHPECEVTILISP